MGGRNAFFRVCVIVSALLLLYVSFPWVWNFADYVRQTHPFSHQHQIQQKFSATDAELACLNGTPLPGERHGWQYTHQTSPSSQYHSEDASSPADAPYPDQNEPIPNIVHFIYGLKNPLENPGAGRFDFMSYLALRSAIVSLRPDAVYLHYTYLSEPPSADPHADPMTNPWIKRLARHITLVHHAPAAHADETQYAHLSDTMRLQFLLEQGGIYLDIDSFALRPFDRLLSAPRPHDVVLGAEGGNRWGLCNAIMAARPNSTFVRRWLDSYKDVDFSREWNYHSVILPKELAARHPREVCSLAPDAFFWPTWTWRHVEWMHEHIGREEADFWSESIAKNSGSLFPNQVAYHAWNQMTWERHLRHLTPRLVAERDTRFNLLMRRFMEDDLLESARGLKGKR